MKKDMLKGLFCTSCSQQLKSQAELDITELNVKKCTISKDSSGKHMTPIDAELTLNQMGNTSLVKN